MFAEKTELKLVEDLNENAIVELGAGDVEEVSGGIAWVAIPLGVKVAGAIIGTGAAGFGAGALASWFANR
ncbi:MAG: hypothetical protein Q4G14_12210 [Paracoccus sp. (in: a-proteobacteria)]|uniref:hypothetical protein n=1 Tax=Paracoccus sp. TaxID=267 RepID=UPI0026E03D42|nr:hypothetical protein [Paracoccus sp. (in: a-proteobacteria)]MDO5613987.1 hypothetical protein [Paracoccus sp. (in: a-proteobacteria)]